MVTLTPAEARTVLAALVRTVPPVGERPAVLALVARLEAALSTGDPTTPATDGPTTPEAP